MCCKRWGSIWREFAWRRRKHVGPRPETNMIGNIPYTPRVNKVLALAGKEAKALHHSDVGTEHILLGLLREGEGFAARVLKSLEVDPARTRNRATTLEVPAAGEQLAFR